MMLECWCAQAHRLRLVVKVHAMLDVLIVLARWLVPLPYNHEYVLLSPVMHGTPVLSYPV